MNPSPDPKVTLVGYSTSAFSTNNKPWLGPLHVIAAIWEQSKTTDTLDEVLERVDGMTEEQLADLLGKVMEGVPVVEAVTFNFIIENASIGWREQMVRHRVGTKPDIRVGADWLTVDTIPEVADMSAWSQSMRLLDMSTFADERRYRTPDAVKAMGPGAVKQWHQNMLTIAAMYEHWTDKGVPREDARDLIPLGATSRLSWSLNLRTLQHICAKRGCTILQLGYWGPIINGIINELSTKVHPVFRTLVTPPCLKGDKWTGCIFPEDNARRLDGRDENLPVCPMFIGRGQGDIADDAREQYNNGTIRLLDDIEEEARKRTEFWGRNAFTGEAE